MAIHILEELKTSGAFTLQKGILTVPNDVDNLEGINTSGIQLGSSSAGFQIKTTSAGSSAYLKGTGHVDISTSDGYVQVGLADNSAYLKIGQDYNGGNPKGYIELTGNHFGGDHGLRISGVTNTVSIQQHLRVGYNPNDGSDAYDIKTYGGFAFMKTFTTDITHSSNTHTIDLGALTNNYAITAQNATNTIAFNDLNSHCVGKSGNIVITNPASVGSLAWAYLPSTAYTPGGAVINWDTNASSVSIMSYFVLASNKILINYVGNFKSYGT